MNHWCTTKVFKHPLSVSNGGAGRPAKRSIDCPFDKEYLIHLILVAHLDLQGDYCLGRQKTLDRVQLNYSSVILPYLSQRDILKIVDVHCPRAHRSPSTGSVLHQLPTELPSALHEHVFWLGDMIEHLIVMDREKTGTFWLAVALAHSQDKHIYMYSSTQCSNPAIPISEWTQRFHNRMEGSIILLDHNVATLIKDAEESVKFVQATLQGTFMQHSLGLKSPYQRLVEKSIYITKQQLKQSNRAKLADKQFESILNKK